MGKVFTSRQQADEAAAMADMASDMFTHAVRAVPGGWKIERV